MSAVDPASGDSSASADAASGDVASGDVASGDAGSGDAGSGDAGSGDAGSADPVPPGRALWVNHGERAIYDSAWVSLHLADVQLPDGTRLDHHVVRVPAHAVATVVVVDDELLMMWRHRFITDTWGWEIPAGRVDPGEEHAEAAARETLEETGWRPGPLTHLVSYHPSNGLTDQHFHVYGASEATYVGEPSDRNEADLVAWISIDTVRRRLRDGELGDGLSFSAVAWWLAVGRP